MFICKFKIFDVRFWNDFIICDIYAFCYVEFFRIFDKMNEFLFLRNEYETVTFRAFFAFFVQFFKYFIIFFDIDVVCQNIDVIYEFYDVCFEI